MESERVVDSERAVDFERAALIALAHVVEPADRRVGAMVRSHGARVTLARIAQGVSGLPEEDGIRTRLGRFDLGQALDQASRIGARILVRDSDQWPSQLEQLGDAQPFALWVLGAASLRLTAVRSIAMVGARAATPYGEAIARQWAAMLADAGWSVVSGGALGIDGVVHRSVLDCGGMTICVLAGGVDVPYPVAHQGLLSRIADEGLLVSESPLGESVRRRRFLTRNRLIAALTRATVVVEAALRSGTTSTANAANALSRPVLAIPGPVSSPMSAGCHQLIREGSAVLASCPNDILEVVEPIGSHLGPNRATQTSPWDRLPVPQARVLDAMPGKRAIGIDDLVAAAGMAVPDVIRSLGALAGQGLVAPVPGGWRVTGRA